MSSTAHKDNVDIVPDILYNKGDIVIIRSNGAYKKRHIYGEKPIWQKWNIGTHETSDWVYSVDYGLGLCSEGFVTHRNIVCLADDRHDDLVL